MSNSGHGHRKDMEVQSVGTCMPKGAVPTRNLRCAAASSLFGIGSPSLPVRDRTGGLVGRSNSFEPACKQETLCILHLCETTNKRAVSKPQLWMLESEIKEPHVCELVFCTMIRIMRSTFVANHEIVLC